MIIFTYPANPLNPKKVDDLFLDESQRVKELGYQVKLLDLDTLKINHNFSLNEKVFYRGWMLNQEQYQKLSVTYPLAIFLNEYLNTHYLKSYYSTIENKTIPTQFYSVYEKKFKDMHYQQYFVKDFVKSLGEKSLCSFHEISQKIVELNKYRGQLEGGISVRKGMVLSNERRYWVVGEEEIYAKNEIIPDILRSLTSTDKVNCPFYSVDVAQREDGTDIIIELNNGQVSDLKEWSLDEFIFILYKTAQMLEARSISFNQKKKISVFK